MRGGCFLGSESFVRVTCRWSPEDTVNGAHWDKEMGAVTEVLYRDASALTPAVVATAGGPRPAGPREQDMAAAKPASGALLLMLAGVVLLGGAAYLMLG